MTKESFGIGFCKHETIDAPMLDVRGIGENYKAFYKWMSERNIQPIWEKDDWPWHSMVLTPYDLFHVVKEWGQYMYYNGDEDASST